MKEYDILQGDVRERWAELADESVHCVVTSPPYWGLRDYGTADWQGGSEECDHKAAKLKSRYDYSLATSPIQDGSRTGTDAPRYKDECPACGARRVDRQLGLEPTPGEFVQHMVEIFREVRRVLRRDGTLWLNLGDSYANAGQTGNDRRGTLTSGGKPRYTPIAGLKPKDLVGMPWRVAFALQEDGWYLRSAITWCKRAPMPESVTDRPTSATEMIFLLSRAEKYYYDSDAVRQPHEEPWRSTGRLENRGTKDVDAGVNNGFGLSGVTPRIYNPAGRNLWNYWLLGPEPYAQAHFATFPTEIPRRAILAGTSAYGVCPAPIKKLRVRRDLTPDQQERVARFLEAKGRL